MIIVRLRDKVPVVFLSLFLSLSLSINNYIFERSETLNIQITSFNFS